MNELKGRTALVTGAAKGIGRGTAELLCQAGATVFFADIDEAGVRQAANAVSAHSIKLDVTSPGDWAAAVEEIQRKSGRLDVLVNNAGIMTTGPFLQMTLETFRREHAINVEGVWLGMQACYPLLAESAKSTAGSSIINLSSIYGQIAGPYVAAYSATKGAVRLLTKSVAVEFAQMKAGIRINTVHPGPVNTDLIGNVMRDMVTAGHLARVEDGIEHQAAKHPMGRIAEVSDIADVILFLASDASRFMTGAELVVDGGYSII